MGRIALGIVYIIARGPIAIQGSMLIKMDGMAIKEVGATRILILFLIMEDGVIIRDGMPTIIIGETSPLIQ
jgi:hypothetical protein